MGKEQKWRKICCPKCKALAGRNCFSEPGKFGTVCLERRQAAEQVVTKVPLTREASIA